MTLNITPKFEKFNIFDIKYSSKYDIEIESDIEVEEFNLKYNIEIKELKYDTLEMEELSGCDIKNEEYNIPRTFSFGRNVYGRHMPGLIMTAS